MLGVEDTGSAIDTIADIIQVALTPVFLLTGIASLLNVFATRLARLAERVETVREGSNGMMRKVDANWNLDEGVGDRQDHEAPVSISK